MIVDRDRLARLLPGYELRDELGSGAFGMVLAGRHLRLKRDVAIKVLAASSRVSQAAFADEASLLAQMDHPHIVRVYDCVEQDGLCLIIMELLAGGTLRARQLTPEGACAVAIAIAEALSYAHDQGVLHRDIKPDNVLFDAGGLPKVTDFGVAKILEGAGVPRPVADLVVHALDTDPRKRGGSAHEFAVRLAAAAELGYGPDWRSRSGIVLRTGDETPGIPVRPGPPTTRRPALPDGNGPRVRTGSTPDAFASRGPSAEPGGPGRLGARPLRRRNRRVPFIVAAALAIVIGLVAYAVSTIGTGHSPDSALPAGNPTPHDRTSASVSARPASPHQASPSASPYPVAGGVASYSPTGFIPDSVAFSPNGTILAVAATMPGGGNGNTYLWSTAGHSASVLHDQGSHGAESVAFSPNGNTLAVGDADGEVYLWRLATGSCTILRVPGIKAVQSVAFALKGTVLATGDANGSTYLWNWATGARIGAALHDSGSMGVQSVAFSPNGAVLAAGDGDGNTYLWNWAAGIRIRTLTDPSAPGIISLSPDVQAVAFGSKGTVLATGDSNGATYLWNWVTGKRTGTLTDPDGQGVYALAFSPDGSVLAVGDANATAYLWDWAAERVTRTLHAVQETHGVSSVAFSRDGTQFAAGDHAGSTFVWHL